jgi:hypothetical protein
MENANYSKSNMILPENCVNNDWGTARCGKNQHE